MKSLNARAWLALAVLAAVMGLLLFVPAGNIHFWRRDPALLVDWWNKQWDTREVPVIAKLKLLAGTDHSGFVTSREGSDLRHAVELGLKTLFLSQNVTTDLARLAKLIGKKEEDLRSALRTYERVFEGLGASRDIVKPLPPSLRNRISASG